MARIIGDDTGTTFKNFLVLPGHTDQEASPDAVSIETDFAGIPLRKPFAMAAMRTIVDEQSGLEGSKAGCLAVAPRGVSVEKEALIVQNTKENAIDKGNIEIQTKPLVLDSDATLGEAIDKTHQYGHSNIPVVDRKAEYVGMFTYRPIHHDRLNPRTPISRIMTPHVDETHYCHESQSSDEIRRYMEQHELRLVPVLDEQGRLSSLVFMQQDDAYHIGAAIDTHDGWEERAAAMIEAGADILFIDTSDGWSDFAGDLVAAYKAAGNMADRYKELFTDGPPICAGNVVTADGFSYLVERGADAVKVGMGSGSICSTNEVLGVGAPPMWALIEVARRRDAYASDSDRYVPLMMDGGIEDTWDINVAATHADAIMGGRLFARFEEAAGETIERGGRRFNVYRGEGSREAALATGNLDRYHMGQEQHSSHDGLYQGVEGLVEITGRLKPGVERYGLALATAMSHAGAHNLREYRQNATLIRLSEQAGIIAHPHGIHIPGD